MSPLSLRAYSAYGKGLSVISFQYSAFISGLRCARIAVSARQHQTSEWIDTSSILDSVHFIRHPCLECGDLLTVVSHENVFPYLQNTIRRARIDPGYEYMIRIVHPTC